MRGVAAIVGPIWWVTLLVLGAISRLKVWWFVAAFAAAGIYWAVFVRKPSLPPQSPTGPGQYTSPTPPNPSPPPAAPAGRSGPTVSYTPAPYAGEYIAPDELPPVAKPFLPSPFATVPDNPADRPYRPYRLDRD